MASIDRLEEEIGWPKVPFGLLLVIDASMLGWLAQSDTAADPVLVLTAGIAVIGVSIAIFWINRSANRRIDDIEET